MSQNQDGKDWVDRVADVAAALGFNRVRVRWKLDRLRQRMAHAVEQAKGKVSHVGYANKVCPHCHSINDAHAKTCARCAQPLRGRVFQALSRAGILTPRFLNVSAVIGLAMALVYARMIADSGSGLASVLSMDTATLFKFGASYAGAYHAGEWYRLLTSVFLHAGLWHLGFNLFALAQLGPFVEELFGKARMMLFFVLTGVFASFGSLLIRAVMAKMAGRFSDVSIAIGASGAIMGLMGIMMGWGFRDGTGIGRGARNMALKWAAYTMVFGFFIGADNGAHAAGFVFGGVIGFAVNPLKLENRALSPVIMVFAVVSGLLIAGATAACLVPMPSPLAAPFKKLVQQSRTPGGADVDPEAVTCGLWRAGDKGSAERQFLVAWSPHILVPKAEIDNVIGRMCVVSPTIIPNFPIAPVGARRTH